MKTRSISDRGSCTTCKDRSESESSSVRRIIDLGSRIDCLYVRKYIPLQRRNLLNGLVGTRMVYEDIRSKLISDSSDNLNTQGDFNLSKKVSNEVLDDPEKSHEAVFKLANRGLLGSKQLEDCCSCASDMKIHDCFYKKHRLKRLYTSENKCGEKERKKAYRKWSEMYNGKIGVQFKTKCIRSEPCTCSYNLIKNQSKAFFKTKHTRPHLPFLKPINDEELKQKRRRISSFSQTSYQNLTQSNIVLIKEIILEGISKIKQTQTRLQEKTELQEQKSSEIFNVQKNKFTSKVKNDTQRINKVTEKSETQIVCHKLNNVIDKKSSRIRQSSQILYKGLMKDSQISGHALKHCFSTLKFKTEATQSKIKLPFTKKVMTIMKSISIFNSAVNNVQTNSIFKCKRTKDKIVPTKLHLLAHDYGLSVCVPENCNPYQYLQSINLWEGMRQNSKLRSRKTKSFPDIISKPTIENSHFRHRNTFSNLQEQSVRVRSIFGLNIEFNKDCPYSVQQIPIPPHLKLSIISQKTMKLKGPEFLENERKIYRNTPIASQKMNKKHKPCIGTKLRKCFSTLKLQTKKIMRNRIIKTVELKPMDTAKNSIQTKSVYARPIEAYKCKPFTCNLSDSDAYVCLEGINKRNIRFKEIGMKTNRIKSSLRSSSNTTKKSLRNVQVQYQTTYKQWNALIRTEKDPSIYKSTAKSAFEIGSTLSFGIELYKSEFSPNELKQIYPIEKLTKSKTTKNSSSTIKNRRHDKEIKVSGLNFAHVENHAQGDWKHEKNVVVGPILKKSFCTSTLQKKRNPQSSQSGRLLFQSPIVYTVNRAMVGDTQVIHNICQIPLHSSFHGKHNLCQIKKTLNSTLEHINDMNDNKRNSPDLQTRKSHKESFKMHSKLDNIEGTVESRDFHKNSLPYSHIQQTSLGRYFRRCLCILNFKVENRGNFKENDIITNSEFRKRKNRYFHNLKPYECEPGVCIPGECDPYECQRRIAKRHMKSSSIQSGTEPTLHSTSSFVSQPMAKYNRNKQQTITQKSKDYKRTFQNKDKQAVRIGSRFSFDIEFSKDLSTSQKKSPKYKKHDFQSHYSKSKTSNAGSLTKPITLKIGKVGRLRDNVQDQQQNFNKTKFVNRKQNTHQNNPLKFTQILLPYECEPNICIPGECDPYECLEIIKKRNYNETGTSPIFPETQSISSMTATDQVEKRNKKHGAMNPPKIRKEIPGNDNSKSSDKNVVRIGSNFSFNIEFYKDHPATMNDNQRRYNRRKPKLTKNTQYQKKPITNSSISFSPSLFSQSTQIEKNAVTDRGVGMHNFMKRCFCTLKLNDYKHKGNQGIRRNRNREFGMSTSYPNKKSGYSLTDPKKFTIKSQTNKGNQFQQRANQTLQKYPTKGNDRQSKQSVRISSTFSFDIEFFKNKPHGLDFQKKPKNDIYDSHLKRQTKNKNTQESATTIYPTLKKTTATMKISTKSQNLGQKKYKTQATSSLKRCFCTLELQKAPFKQRQIYTDNKKIATTKIPMKVAHVSPFECEPFYCVPGECDPYECLERIKIRDNMYKSQSTMTSSILQPQKMYDNTAKIKSQRSHAKIIDTNTFNKNVVRIGSNINFNIEFYKEGKPQTALSEQNYGEKIKREKKDHYRHQNTNRTRSRSSGTINQYNKKQNKSTWKENTLKRCFCTLKLNKKHNMNYMTPFPQTFNVGRIAVHCNPKMLSKRKQPAFKSLVTKIDKKNFKTYICPNGRTLSLDYLDTILPYASEKYVTELSQQNRYNEPKQTMISNRSTKQACGRGKKYLHEKFNTSETLITLQNEFKKQEINNHDTKLRRERGNKYLHNTEATIQKNTNENSFFSRIKYSFSFFLKFFKPKSISKKNLKNTCNYMLLDEMTSSKKGLGRPNHFMSYYKAKKTTCPLCSQNIDNKNARKYKLHKKQITKFVFETLNMELEPNQQIMTYKKNADNLNYIKRVVKKNKKRSSPLKVLFFNTTVRKNGLNDNMNVKPSTNKAFGEPSGQVTKSLKFCDPCRLNINKEEFQNAAGDHFSNQLNV